MGLGEGWLSKSQAWDRHQKEWFWVLLWGIGFVPALILISAVSVNEIFFTFCFGNLRDVSPLVISSLSCDFCFLSLLSNIPRHSTVSHLKMNNTFLKPTSFPYCRAISLLPLEANSQKSRITSSKILWYAGRFPRSPTLAVFFPGSEGLLQGKVQWILQSSSYLDSLLLLFWHLDHHCAGDTISSDFPLFLATSQFPFQTLPWPILFFFF